MNTFKFALKILIIIAQRLITALSLPIMLLMTAFCADFGSGLEIAGKIAGLWSIYVVFLFIFWFWEIRMLQKYLKNHNQSKILILLSPALVLSPFILCGLLFVTLAVSMDFNSSPRYEIIPPAPTDNELAWVKNTTESEVYLLESIAGDRLSFMVDQPLRPPTITQYTYNPKWVSRHWLGYEFSLQESRVDTVYWGYFGLFYTNENFSDSCVVSLKPHSSEPQIRTGKEIPCRPVTFVANDTFENCIVSTMHGSPAAPIDTFVISRAHGPVYISFKDGRKFTRPDLNRQQ